MNARAVQTILIIDDNVQITQLLRGILRQEGYRVIISNQPTLCGELMERESPDLVVVDICMPGMDGWQVCQQIRTQSKVPILVLTVLAEKRYVARTMEAGANAHMSKPFVIGEFLEQVRNLLPKRVRRLDASRS
jgi:DNA-binding response OmpR family regulator